MEEQKLSLVANSVVADAVCYEHLLVHFFDVKTPPRDLNEWKCVLSRNDIGNKMLTVHNLGVYLVADEVFRETLALEGESSHQLMFSQML